jgi:Protein of unknown function (DUF3689)
LLFVLYALLSGKRKAELQDRLASLGLVQIVTGLFEKTDWFKPPTPAPHERAPHGPQCECNPDAALKIQLLRLILNFCDGDFENRHNKRLLLSREEIAGLRRSPANSNLRYSEYARPPAPTTNGTVPGGLLSKLIKYYSSPLFTLLCLILLITYMKTVYFTDFHKIRTTDFGWPRVSRPSFADPILRFKNSLPNRACCIT